MIMFSVFHITCIYVKMYLIIHYIYNITTVFVQREHESLDSIVSSHVEFKDLISVF